MRHNTWDYTPNEITLPWWLLAQPKGSVHGNPAEVNGFTTGLSGKKVLLQWEIPAESWPPTDDDIWYCKIYRDATIIQEVYNNLNSFVDSSVVAVNSYEYQISAVNYFFQESALSAPVDITITK